MLKVKLSKGHLETKINYGNRRILINKKQKYGVLTLCFRTYYNFQ